VALKLCFFVLVTSCDEFGKILGHLPTQQNTAVDENEFSVLMMYLVSVSEINITI